MLTAALQNIFAPAKPMSWTEAFFVSVAATLAFVPAFAVLYLAKSALGINVMSGPSPLHDLLYQLVR
jgi:hypothetical protein